MHRTALLPVLLTLTACGTIGVLITPEERVEIEGLIQAAKDAARPKDDARRLALADAVVNLGPRPDLGTCRLNIAKPEVGDPIAPTDDNKSWNYVNVPISIVKVEDIGVVDGPRYDQVEDALTNEISGLLYSEFSAPDHALIEKKIARAKDLADPRFIPRDITLVLDQFKAPVTGKDGFEGGSLRGRMFVYDYESASVVCAAMVWAENSERLEVHAYVDPSGDKVGSQTDLLRDLYWNGVSRGLDSLAAAGPVVVAVP